MASASVSGLVPIDQRQYHPLLSRLRRPQLVATQGFIHGKWLEAHDQAQFAVLDPATEEEIACIANMGKTDTLDAVGAATAAQCQWKKTTPPTRADLLKKWATAITANAEDLAVIGAMECGKPLRDLKQELEFTVEVIKYYAHEVTRQSGFVISPTEPSKKVLVVKEPVGVCGVITPSNFPFTIVGMNLAPPLAAGCTVVLKPAGEAPLSALALTKLSEDVGFPPGVINVVTSSRARSKEAGLVLTSHAAVRKISFVGSTSTGKWIMAQCAATLKRVALRLGGNAPFIVFDDADKDLAVDVLVKTKFQHAGQVCIASNRIFVHESIYHEFTNKLVARIKSLKMGPPLEHGVQIGPLIGPSAVEKVSELVDDAVQHGATVLLGGKTNRLGKNFYEPTVLTDVNESMRLWQEEIFGPVVPLFVFSSEAEVVRKSNDTPMGLAGYFFTQDVSRMFRVAGELECGMVGVNSGVVLHAGAPYGGLKESGVGREGSLEGLEEYQETKMLSIGGLV